MLKKHAYKTIFAALVTSLLTGCIAYEESTKITMNDVRNMDYGSYPKNYEKAIRQHLARTLIDPNSLMLDETFSSDIFCCQIFSRRFLTSSILFSTPSISSYRRYKRVSIS